MAPNIQMYRPSKERALIDIVHAALNSKFDVARCLLSWNAPPYYLAGFRLTARRDGCVVVRHVVANTQTRAARRMCVLAALEPYQRALAARGVHAQLIDERSKAPQLVCCAVEDIMSIKGVRRASNE
jgi:hypothetical protein